MFPKRSTLSFQQTSLIISPSIDLSVLLSAENSNLLTIEVATSCLIKKHWLFVELTILYTLPICSFVKLLKSIPLIFSFSSSDGTYTKSFGERLNNKRCPFSLVSGTDDKPCFCLS